jgi:hypothetical protein
MTALELSRTAKQICLLIDAIFMWYELLQIRIYFLSYSIMHRRADEESTTSQSKKARRLTMDNDAPSSERKLKTL